MFEICLSDLLRMLLVLGGPRAFISTVPWPLHAAVVEMEDARKRQGRLRSIAHLALSPDPEVGTRVAGLDAALSELVASQELQLGVSGGLDVWKLDEARLHRPRRALWALPAEDLELLRETAHRWESLATASLKNWRTAVASSASTVASSTPNRRRELEPASWR